MFVTIQPFGLASPGGGPRILRALLLESGIRFTSICTSPQPPLPLQGGAELHIPSRPPLGRIEATRLGSVTDGVEWMLKRRLAGRLLRECGVLHPAVIHALAHTGDFWPAFRTAQRLRTRFTISVHDDLLYHAERRPFLRLALRRLPAVWRAADACFVITDDMGEEYCRRYGRRSYVVVTDGLHGVTEQYPDNCHSLARFYFMGLFHLSYRPNFEGFVEALRIRRRDTNLPLGLTCRCSWLPPGLLESGAPIRVLPFGTEEDVRSDLQGIDAVYLPLPFDPDFDLFIRLSLPTKLITYLGSGRPILYHGPAHSSAARLLRDNDAAILVHSLDPSAVSHALGELSDRRETIVSNALRLARSRFDLARIRAAFLSASLGTQQGVIPLG